MRVKIGDTWYNSSETPICVQLSEGERRQIADMDPQFAPRGKYAVFPSGWGARSEMFDWMHDDPEAEKGCDPDVIT